jgi:type II secretory pathway pseudopilin PulG
VRRRLRGERGLGLVEVLFTLAMIGGLFAVSARTLAAAQSAQVRTNAKDAAVAYGYTLIEQGRSFGCGVEVGSEHAARPPGSMNFVPILHERAAQCEGLGKVDPLPRRFGNYDFDAEIRTSWVTSTSPVAPSTSCGHMTAPLPADHPDAPGVVQPNLLKRTVDITYEVRNLRSDHQVVSFENRPPDAVTYNGQTRGSVVIRGVSEDDDVSIRSSTWDPGLEIIRAADDQGCVWFPFLVPGPYSVRVNAGAPIPVNVTRNAAICRTRSGAVC